MTSSGSSSSSGRRGLVRCAALVAACAALSACARAPVRERASIPRPRIVLLPTENLSGKVARTREVQAAIELELRRRFEVVSGDILEQFLSRHRLRFTGGVDAETAAAARDELGADAILVSSLLSYQAGPPPVVGVAARLVTASERPIILWADQRSFAGDEAPGLLALGVVDSLRVATDRVVTRLVRSLDGAIEGKPADDGCGGGARYRPQIRFRTSLVQGRVVALTPFLNWSARRGAGDVVSLEFLRHLVGTGEYHVLEPGVVRTYMLRGRMMIPGGVSLETTRMFLGSLEADYVLGGTVSEFGDGVGAAGPTARFTATLIDGHTGEVVWHSRSSARGDDGVWLFGLGRVATPGQLLCRMVRPIAGELAHLGSGGVEEQDRGTSLFGPDR